MKVLLELAFRISFSPFNRVVARERKGRAGMMSTHLESTEVLIQGGIV